MGNERWAHLHWKNVPGAYKCKYRRCERPVLPSGTGRAREYCCGGCRKNEFAARRRDDIQVVEHQQWVELLQEFGVPLQLVPVLQHYERRYGEKAMMDTAWLIGAAFRYHSPSSPAVTKEVSE